MKKELKFSTIYKASYWVLLVCFMVACKSDDEGGKTETKIDKSFLPFYDKFHESEAYQLEHINFPIQGLPVQTDSAGLAEHKSYINKEDWVFQQDFDEQESGFTKEIVVLTPNLVEEIIVNKEQTIGMIRRFAKLGDDWYLIYYTGLGRMKKQ